MRLLSSLLLLALAVPAAAQEREIRSANLPPDLEWELLRLYDGAAERMDGPATIEAERVITGDVAAMNGPLRVLGRVEGNLAMVNGDVIIEPGGEVTGDITVVGGEVRMGDGAEVGGTIVAYGTSTRRRSGRDEVGEDEDDWDWDWDEDDWWDRRRSRWDDRGYARFAVRTGSSYNRVEGLPIMFGPVLQTAGERPLRLEALAVWRSESGASLDTDRMGYQVEAEQFLDRGHRLSLGGSAFSVVAPMDRWQISDLEASLATVLFHDDYRDYHERTGWSLFARARPVRGLEARLAYRQEDHASVAAADPWSLFDGDDAWRYQPLVAEGDLRVVSGSLEVDGRDDRDDPARGLYGRLVVERPVGGTLTRPAILEVGATDGLPGSGEFVSASEVDTDFTSAFLDLRSYNLVGWDSQLVLRLVAGGALSERPLPAQYQHALGGPGTLPGFDTFSLDCGARSLAGSLGTSRYYPSYGCDRFALAQVEYRGDISLDFGFGDPDWDDDDWWDDVDVDLSPSWVVFFDAGQGWAYEDALYGPDRDTGLLFDAGLGFLIEDVGIYAALPLNGDVDQEPRFFLRLGRRF